MTANKPMTGEQLDELMAVAVNMQRDSEKANDRPAAMFAYAVQVAVLELRNVRNDAVVLEQKLAESQREFRAADATIENLQMQVEKLAAENAGLIEQAEEVYAAGYNHGHLNTVDGIAYADCVKDDFYGLAVELMREAETPATDAFLAEVWASELESLAGVAETMMVKFANQGVSDIPESKGWEMIFRQASQRAAQLRKGVQS
ncbi:hypothetical protein [Enterobacter asburiae]|uniref:hypothetical protein n=1 Tax=Enterobacter asburiae TaxID=61645 RepID=UPI0015E9A3EC|nr:hypothetical protein [Enterobacter asburiae]QLY64901.1 hypothetical protein HV228_09050 [Enterobacter asburiae]